MKLGNVLKASIKTTKDVMVDTASKGKQIYKHLAEEGDKMSAEKQAKNIKKERSNDGTMITDLVRKYGKDSVTKAVDTSWTLIQQERKEIEKNQVDLVEVPGKELLLGEVTNSENN